MHPKIATSSSIAIEDWISSMAINGIQDAGSDYEDMFNSGAENYPWLAIDLGFLYKVSYIFLAPTGAQGEAMSCVRDISQKNLENEF